MQTFLQLVAQDLYPKIGNDLSRVAIVFPNKRASLFFNEYLAMQSDRPIWSPAYVSISELFRQLSPWKSGDPIRLVCELYKVFREETRSEETLDDFYFWGELLISDFDDVDKNLVDADRLFSNLQDLKNIMDDYDFLDSEQEEAIRQFFQNFSIERRTQLKEKFISLWDKLGDIYHHYRRNLEELGIAYEGMMYRYVMEELQPDKLKYEHYVFVGFNVLNKVETKFFERLREAGKALFKAKPLFGAEACRRRESLQFFRRRQQPFLYQTAAEQLHIRPAVCHFLPDAPQQFHSMPQLQDMLLFSCLKGCSGQPSAQRKQRCSHPMKQLDHSSSICRTLPGSAQPCSSTSTRSIPCCCKAFTCGRLTASSALAA